jgi:hypothetical protein
MRSVCSTTPTLSVPLASECCPWALNTLMTTTPFLGACLNVWDRKQNNSDRIPQNERHHHSYYVDT